ncbi:hypothetical protein RX327_09525 [Bradyrhizobium sp. BEA-2-5]|uniref:hypothetical protein n=1 Tax=Bradyrhizobium TaxID=374 RepID=UPI000A554894|nr:MULTISPECIES: hypothetical protein [Bradyrhizobium]WOH83349.1 hypothetical protein RX327_09525 [Bradyrhizobium sp. BEA-2-5]
MISPPFVGIRQSEDVSSIVVAESLPRNATGKVQKSLLCDRFADISSAEVQQRI